jgi:cytochrome c553
MKLRNIPFILSGISIAILLVSCGDSSGTNTPNNSTTMTTTPVESYTITPGRLLAAQCAQCHGTNGVSTNDWDSIAGDSAAELVKDMLEIKEGDEDLIMQAQAHGYTDVEIKALAGWLATQTSPDDDD